MCRSGHVSCREVSRLGSTRVAGTLRTEVIAAARHWSTGQQRLVRLVAALDRSGEWALDGARTCAHWIADALDVEVCTAREWLRVGHSLAELDEVDRAFAEGRLSYSKVRVVTRVATAENQVELCALAERVPAGRLAHALATWLTRHETPERTERRQRLARGLTWRTEPDGMIVGIFRLEPASAAIVTGAIDAKVLQATGEPTERGVYASADACTPLSARRWPAAPSPVRSSSASHPTRSCAP
jgi:hypothetical protein